MSRIEGELAASQAEVASLRGALSQSRADASHFRDAYWRVCERTWAGDRRGMNAFIQGGRPEVDPTGFCDQGWI